MQAARYQPAECGVGAAGQEKKQSCREHENATRNKHGQRRQARMKALQAGARNLVGLLHGAADFGTGERGNRRQQIEAKEEQKVQAGREDRSRQDFQERYDGGVEIIAIGTSGQNLDDGEEEHQVDSRLEESARQKKIVQRIEADIRHREDSDDAIGNRELAGAAEQQGAQK